MKKRQITKKLNVNLNDEDLAAVAGGFVVATPITATTPQFPGGPGPVSIGVDGGPWCCVDVSITISSPDPVNPGPRN